NAYMATGDHVTALGLMGMQGFMVALFTIIGFGKINSFLKKFVYGLSSLWVDSIEIVKFTLIKVFILTIISSFVLSCALAGILYLFVKLFKGNATYKQTLCIASARSIAVIPIILIAMVAFYFKPALGILIFFLGNILGICFIMNAFAKTFTDF